MEMLLTGDLIPAEEARRIGLVNRVVAPGSERDEALALARQIASKSALTVKIGKEAFYRQLEMSLADAYRYTVGGDGGEHAGARRRGRHRRVHRESERAEAGKIARRFGQTCAKPSRS